MTQIAAARTIFTVPLSNMPKFKAQIEKLSRKAVRLGCSEISYLVVGEHRAKLSDRRMHIVQEILFVAEVPRIDGWTFAATIDHTHETGNIVRNVPNSLSVPEHYRTAEPCCDHCGVRRYRRDTYVLHSDDGQDFKQVGKTCLKDFFGHDPSKIVKLAEMLGYAAICARGFGEPVGFGREYLSVHEFAAHCARAVRLHGWVSRKAARADTTDRLRATSYVAAETLFQAGSVDPAPDLLPTQEDRDDADSAIEWAQSLIEKPEKSDYEHNICVIGRASFIEYRSMGLLASIVGVWMKKHPREEIVAKAVAVAKRRDSEHQGEIKQILRNLSLEILSETQCRSNDFGTPYLYRMADEHGNIFMWKAATYRVDIAVGTKICLKGTVEKHEEFKGTKNTWLKRCAYSITEAVREAA